MVRMLWLRRFIAMIKFVLNIRIQSLRMEWSMKNAFPNHIFFPEITSLFDITASSVSFNVY